MEPADPQQVQIAKLLEVGSTLLSFEESEADETLVHQMWKGYYSLCRLLCLGSCGEFELCQSQRADRI